MQIRNIVASWRGSTHDSRIFNESNLKTQLEQLPGKYHLLGDKGYPCLRYLMTPVSNPTTPSEKKYNYAQSSTRIAIERLNGVLKRRFPCLAMKLRFEPTKCCSVIVACAVLHNLSILLKDEEVPENDNIEEEDDDDEEYVERNVNLQGSGKRRAIINRFF